MPIDIEELLEVRLKNEDDFLKESIGSICNFVDEIVLINNKCTDNSVE